MGSIYCLFSTKDAVPRYIGKASDLVYERYLDHRRKAQDGKSRRVYPWMRRAWLTGFEIDYLVIATEIPPGNLNYQEGLWIRKIPNLLNERGNRSKYFWDDELLEKLQELCKRRTIHFAENYNGFHGIRYYRRQDAYTARISFGFEDGPCWVIDLEGDELLPGQIDPRGSAVWFTDLNNAIEARDRDRARIDADIRQASTGWISSPYRILSDRSWKWQSDELP